jgi:hypothetical protein
MSYRRARLTGVYLADVWLIGVRLKPPSHTGRHCVGWHAVVCYGVPEWFRPSEVDAIFCQKQNR